MFKPRCGYFHFHTQTSAASCCRTTVPGTIPPTPSRRRSPCTWTASSYTEKTTVPSLLEVMVIFIFQIFPPAVLRFTAIILTITCFALCFRPTVDTAAETQSGEQVALNDSKLSPVPEVARGVYCISKATQTQALPTSLQPSSREKVWSTHKGAVQTFSILTRKRFHCLRTTLNSKGQNWCLLKSADHSVF